MKRRVLLSVLALHLVDAPAITIVAVPEQTRPEAIETKGRELAAALRSRYDARIDARDPTRGGHGDWLEDVVEAVIPIGTSFDDAEGILRAAGFQVSARKKAVTGGQPTTYAGIDTYPPGARTWGCKRSVSVLLHPDSPDDWRRVASLSARFVVGCL